MSKVKNAIILLAGMGSRLKPLTENIHKALIPIGTQSILQRQLYQLVNCGIEHVHLVLGYRAEDIKSYIQNLNEFKTTFHLYHNAKFDQTNTGYSLNLVLQELKEAFLLLDGDVVLDLALVEELCRDTSENLLLSDTDKNKLNAEAVKFATHNGQIVKIGKAIPLAQAQGESIGVGLFQKDWAVELNSVLNEDMKTPANWNWYYEDAMQKILEQNSKISPLKIQAVGLNKWVEIDDHDDLNQAKKLFG